MPSSLLQISHSIFSCQIISLYINKDNEYLPFLPKHKYANDYVNRNYKSKLNYICAFPSIDSISFYPKKSANFG